MLHKNTIAIVLLLALAGCNNTITMITPTPATPVTQTNVPVSATQPETAPVILPVYGVVTDSLYLRDCPAASCDVIFAMPQGTLIALDGLAVGEWVHGEIIAVPGDNLSDMVGQRGWCNSAWVERH